MSSSQRDLFAADCALTGPLEFSVSAVGQPPRQHQLAQPWALVGRKTGMTLQLDDVAVSQRHAYLQVLGSRLFAVDLESRTGLSLDGIRRHATWIDPGQNLAVGPYQLQLQAPPPPASPTHPVPSGDPLKELPETEPALLASIDFYLGTKRIGRWRMNRLLALVGSSARCRVRLRDTSVSRVHCSLVATPRGVWVVDLRSRMGTRLRGELIGLARLEEGDTLQIGTFFLRINYQRPAVGAAPTPHTYPAGPVDLAANPPLVLRGGAWHGRETVPQPGLLTPPTALAAGNEPNLLVPLMQHFQTLQQQMFDQFQQTMVMVVQMLTSMHQEQASLVREELRLFRNATEELNRLEAQLRSNRVPSQAPPSPATPAAESKEASGPQPAEAQAGPPACLHAGVQPGANGGVQPSDRNATECVPYRPDSLPRAPRTSLPTSPERERRDGSLPRRDRARKQGRGRHGREHSRLDQPAHCPAPDRAPELLAAHPRLPAWRLKRPAWGSITDREATPASRRR